MKTQKRLVKTSLSRRDFLKVAGLSTAAAMLPSFLTGCASAESPEASAMAASAGDDTGMSMTAFDQVSVLEIGERTVYNTDILVIGGGMAGAFAAVTAREQGLNVVLVDKATVGRSGATPWANTFSVFDEEAGDDRDEWSSGVSTSSDYVNNLDWLDQTMDESKGAWQTLEDWGMFEDDVQHPSLVLRDVLLANDVTLVERTMVTTLLTEGDDERVIGAMGFSIASEQPVVVLAKATIMCAGAGSFKAPGFPIQGLTSDGDAMAYRAGARISGKEWIDFHWTSSEAPASCWNQWGGMWETGVNKTSGVFTSGMTLEGAFAIHDEDYSSDMSGEMSGDRPEEGEDGERPEPPDGEEVPEGEMTDDDMRGEDSERGSAPGQSSGEQVSGAATGLGIHKAEGIWPTSMQGASDVPGLFGAGDALASMLCGASYAGIGLSLSASATQGASAAQGAAEYAQQVSAPSLSDEELDALQTEMYAPRELESGFSPAWITQVLQNAMFPYYVLFVKQEDRLQAALTNIMFIQENLAPRMTASSAHELKLAHETHNMLLNAEMKLRASIARKESRGTHYREDYPARDDENFLVWILMQQDENGDMVLSTEAVPEEWRPDESLSYEEIYPTRFPGELEYLGLE